MSEEVVPTATAEEYLEAIHHIGRRRGGVRCSDIADALGIHRSTVTGALKTLCESGWVAHSPYGAVELTATGAALAERVARRNRVLRNFLTDVLLVDADEARRCATGMGHSASAAIIEGLSAFMDVRRACRRCAVEKGMAACMKVV